MEANLFRNPNIHFFENLKCPKKSDCFDTGGYPVAFFVAKISPKIHKTIQKSEKSISF